MNKKQRVHAALEGKPVDRCPVAVPYIQLYHQDHFSKLTGHEPWEALAWIYDHPKNHVEVLKGMVEKVDFDIVQPQWTPPHEKRQRTQFLEIRGQPFSRDIKSGHLTSLRTVSGQLLDDEVNQIQHIYSIEDARRIIKITPAREIARSGVLDHALEAVSVLGKDRFILTSGVLGAWYSCVEHLGMTNLFALAAEQPEFIDYLCQRGLEQNIENIQAAASAGGDAIYIDDATMTSDMVSSEFYGRFSLQYTSLMVEEIHRLNHKAILIYFGGVMDRLDLIAECGADGLIVETSMKGYINDIAEIIHRIGKQVTLFGNIDPVGVLEKGSEEDLAAEVHRQLTAGREGRGFILSTGSPVTPGTNLERVNRLINLAKVGNRGR